MTYFITKVLNPLKGYSCAFRNWRAESHCHLWHGYDLVFSVTIEADELNEQGWVFDFGGFTLLKNRIEEHFDHTWIIAEDDPLMHLTKAYVNESRRIGHPCAKLVTMPHVGVEHFAQWLAVEATDMLMMTEDLPRCRVRHAHVSENGANTGGFIV